MSETKEQIEAESLKSKSRCYEDIRASKVREICVFYPAIGTLTAGKFKELWDAA
ncbi:MULTISPECIES: hypothetical protein [Clostridia]|jgi:hypothetical protein|uniref:hypothetical protein n=1 Tax=Clostridia TaxID=186801 RepID=UPI0012E27B57|nr:MULTISPECIES: hypothetical protein [Clostridia]